MTAQDDPYVRVYYRIIDDPKFADVYDDDRALALWLRLLLHADAMYPAPAMLPPAFNKKALDKLVRAGLVDVGTGYRFRIHGLQVERDRRAEAARFAADVKNHGKEEAERRQSARKAAALRAQSDSTAEVVPLQDEPLRASPLQSAPLRANAGAREKNGSKTLSEERAELVERVRSDAISADMRNAIYARIEQIDNLMAAN